MGWDDGRAAGPCLPRDASPGRGADTAYARAAAWPQLLARLDLVRRRWDLAIIASLRDGGVRPAGLMRVINAQAGERRLTWKVLAERLDWLESEGYVTRRQVDPGEHGTGCGPGHAGHWRHSTRWLHGTTSLKARHMAHEGPTLCAGDIDGREIQRRIVRGLVMVFVSRRWRSPIPATSLYSGRYSRVTECGQKLVALLARRTPIDSGRRVIE
jgi:hypothetical protein